MAGTGGWTYILASKRHGTLYTGVTSNLLVRVQQHRSGEGSAFAARYGCINLVWYEYHSQIESAIQREKSIKRYRREWKLNLVERLNPQWSDLFDECYDLENPTQLPFPRRMDPRDGARG